MPRLPWLLVPILACALITTPKTRANSPLPSGLADFAGRTGYLTMIRGQLEAVDLQTGDTLWENVKAHRALHIVGDRLFAFSRPGETVRVLALDLRNRGEVVLETDPVGIPAWCALRDEPGQSFRWLVRTQAEFLEISWEARAWYAGRDRATPERETAARKHVSGLLRIHMVTGKLQALPSEFPGTPAAIPPTTVRESIRWSGAADGHIFALVVDQVGTTQTATLRAWNSRTGQELPARPILTGRRLQVLPGLGDRHLFVRDTLPSPADTQAAPVRWHIWSLEKGEIVGRVPYEPGSIAGTVVGSRAYFVKIEPTGGTLDRAFTQPRTLQVVDAPTGRLLWERPVEGKLIAPPPP